MNAQLKLRRTLAASLIAAAVAGPALGQSQGLSPTGPGTAAAARVSTVTATVTAIDLPTRQVTLRRPDGNTLTVSAPFHLEGVDKVPAKRAPSIGQHSDEVLREAGYSAGEISRLRESGVLA